MPQKPKAAPTVTITAASTLPLSTLLSQTLVAFTIEFDNQFEHQMPHRTTKHGASAGTRVSPWLGSLVLWSTCMQFVGEDGVRVGELERLARTTTNLAGMERWRYIDIAPDPSDTRPKPPHADWIIRATHAGRLAQQVWGPLFATIEQRWQQRFGKRAIEQLRRALWAIAGQFDLDLPDCLPILHYGLLHKVPDQKRPTHAARDEETRLPLSALLSRVLLAFALEFERESHLSLAISANVMRVLDSREVPVRDLPLLSGVSKESLSMATGFLEKKGLAVIQPDPAGSRSKVASLTPEGRAAYEICHRLLGVLEEDWQTRFGSDAIASLRASLEPLVGDTTPENSPLFQGLEPYPDGWRASIRKPQTLPHYPMVLHRGGYPDGS